MPAINAGTAEPMGVSPPEAVAYQVLVRKLRSNYSEDDNIVKQDLLRSITEMAEKQAIYPGDSDDIGRIIDIVYSFNESPNQILHKYL